MQNPSAKFLHHRHLLLLFLLLIAAGKLQFCKFADAAQRKIHIPDELDDVVDDEEDDEWREWGAAAKKRPDFDLPPTDFAKMQDSVKGPVFGFVKLRPGTPRTPETVSEIAMKWSRVARTGATEARFSGVDVSTVMFTMPKGLNLLELKEYLLSQPEAYEIKIGDQLFRRPGDPTFDEVFHKIQMEKAAKSSDANTINDERHHEL